MAARTPLPSELRGRAFSVSEAQSRGVRPGRLRGADLSRPFRGIRIAGDTELTAEAMLAAYLPRMSRGQIFSHLTAARIWAIPLPRRLTHDERIHVAVRAPRTPPRARGVVGHQFSDEAVRGCQRLGVPVTDAASTWCHLAAILGEDDLVAAADHLVLTPAKQNPRDRRPYVSLGALAARVAQYHGPGARAAKRALKHVRDGAESRQETRLRLLLIRAGLPEPELNVNIFDSHGRWLGRADQVHRRWKVIVEYDGEQHRTDDRQYDRDEIKIEDFIDEKWRVVRIRKHSMLNEGADAVARVTRAMRDAGWRP